MKKYELDPVQGFDRCKLGMKREEVDPQLYKLFKNNLTFDNENILRSIGDIRSENVFLKNYQVYVGDALSKMPSKIYQSKNKDVSINEKVTSGREGERFVSFSDCDNIYLLIDKNETIRAISLIDKAWLLESTPVF